MKGFKVAVLAASVIAAVALGACRKEEPMKLGASDIVSVR
jgi:hypothetical protein